MSPDESPVEDAYDDMARTYERHEDDPYCADFEFLATTDLVPDVDGRRVLDAGFRLEELIEPRPEATFAERKPESYEKRRRYPTFLCVSARLER